MDDPLPPGDRHPVSVSLEHHQYAPVGALPTASPSAVGTASSSPTIYHPDQDTELGTAHFQAAASTGPPPNFSATAEPYSKWFWARGDEAMHRARVVYLKTYLGGLFLVALAIFGVFSIYWGSLWKVPAHTLKGWIVDFDGGEVGQFMVQALTGTKSIIAWKVRPASDFPQGLVDVVARMKNDEAWVTITINPGASSAVQNSLAQPDPSYNASLAITAFGVEARNENAYRNFIRPIVQTSLDVAKFRYAMNLAGTLSNSSINIQNVLQISPQTIISPVSYTIVNLVPFNQPVASAVVFVGLIYLLILAFFIVMIAHGAREASGINRLLKLRSLIMLRLASSCFGYFMLSLFYSLLNLAFKLDMTRKYGRAGFMAFWMLNWIGMLSVGLALESLITVLTPRFIPFFMILWIICNVSVCIFPIDILPRIYHYGYAAPFYNISNSIRSIAFGTKNTLGLNFGVLFAWVVISFMTLPILQWYVRRNEIQALERPKAPSVSAAIGEKRQSAS